MEPAMPDKTAILRFIISTGICLSLYSMFCSSSPFQSAGYFLFFVVCSVAGSFTARRIFPKDDAEDDE